MRKCIHRCWSRLIERRVTQGSGFELSADADFRCGSMVFWFLLNRARFRGGGYIRVHFQRGGISLRFGYYSGFGYGFVEFEGGGFNAGGLHSTYCERMASRVGVAVHGDASDIVMIREVFCRIRAEY